MDESEEQSGAVAAPQDFGEAFAAFFNQHSVTGAAEIDQGPLARHDRGLPGGSGSGFWEGERRTRMEESKTSPTGAGGAGASGQGIIRDR
ncbi:MAG TPA: hypothetical protein VNC50_19035, partial [Planctomycetia bacterium]|nr:hypothetical protein [Planctomycetia bacterium]